jgi:hypothetical protein
LDAAVAAKLPMGWDITVVESPAEAAPWVRIKLPNAEGTGWVHSDYIEYAGAPAQEKVTAQSHQGISLQTKETLLTNGILRRPFSTLAA